MMKYALVTLLAFTASSVSYASCSYTFKSSVSNSAISVETSDYSYDCTRSGTTKNGEDLKYKCKDEDGEVVGFFVIEFTDEWGPINTYGNGHLFEPNARGTDVGEEIEAECKNNS